MINFIRNFNNIIFLVLTFSYVYQVFYLFVGIFSKKLKTGEDKEVKLSKYAIIIAARDEAAVIGELIKTLKRQNYPAGLIDIYVVADNCTDNTAEIAEGEGAVVYKRFDKVKVGKGYALDYCFALLEKEGKANSYEGYFVFDADNLVHPNFVLEMNKVFNQGFDAVTSYRNSKNYSTNWITAGYSLWFLREARFLNFPRMALNTNCAISGTGFLVSAELIRRNGGWKYHLLTEDIEFSAACAIEGTRIGYCDKAYIYDEQPVTFGQSWNQRLRWAKGFYQVMRNYGVSLVRGFFSLKKNAFSCYDMFMTIAPATFLTLLCMAVNLSVFMAFWGNPTFIAVRIVQVSLKSLSGAIINFYIMMFIYGLLTVISEWKHIMSTPMKKVMYLFTFPLFLFTYVPISLVALIKKVEWKPITHSVSKKLEEIS